MATTGSPGRGGETSGGLAALKGEGEGGIWARKSGKRRGTPASKPLFSPSFLARGLAP